MEKTLKRQIGYKPGKEKKPVVESTAAPVVEPLGPAKMGRKEKAPEDRVQGVKVYLTVKEIALIEKKHGSLTAAIKTTMYGK